MDGWYEEDVAKMRCPEVLEEQVRCRCADSASVRASAHNLFAGLDWRSEVTRKTTPTRLGR